MTEPRNESRLHSDPVNRVEGLTVEAGSTQGMPLRLAEPLSFWGGYDSNRGIIIEPAHPNHGVGMSDKVLLMARSKGSSSSSSVLAEAIRNGTGPRAIIMLEPDLIVALGAIVARELYGIAVPIVVLRPDDWHWLAETAATLTVHAAADGYASISWARAAG